MADKATDPRELFVQMLGEILTVERALADEILPQMSEQAQNQELADGFAHHAEETREQVRNVEEAFSKLGAEPQAETNRLLDGLVEQHEKAVGKVDSEQLEDLVHAAAAAKTEHIEMAAYNGLITMAQAMGEGEVVELLQANLRQEQETLQEVEQVSERLVGQLVAG